MFGGQKTPFGTSSTFGGTPSFGSTFGQPAAQAGATSLFGAKPSVSFGATTTAMPTGSLFGTPANAFGTTGTVGGTSGGLFGGTSTFNTPTAGTLFGGPSTQTKPLFGASTTAADGGGRADRSAVQALNFDNTAYGQESDGRSIVSPSSSVLRGSSFVSDNAGSPSDRQEKTNLVSNTPASTSSGTATSAASTTTPPIHASPSTVSSSSQTPASPDENQLQSDHPAGIILTKSEYYTIPSLKELEKLVDRSTGDCFVNGFTVGRTEYGSIFWPGETNVAGLNLDELVHFRHKEVMVYDADEKRPPYGTELNKDAEVTLERVWPMDKTTRASIKDPKRLELMKYREKLEKATIQMETDFVDYRPDTGSWVFMVPHFSKYGLADELDALDKLITKIWHTDFPLAKLPDIVLLKIIRYLPMQSKSMMAMVNQRFHDLAMVAISETKCVNLDSKDLAQLTTAGFAKLLRSCASNVRRISLRSDPKRVRESYECVLALSMISFRRLEELDLRSAYMGHRVFPDLFVMCPNLRRLVWLGRQVALPMTIYPKTTSEKLSSLQLGQCDADLVRSFAERCPNLKDLRFTIWKAVPLGNLDDTFRFCTKLEKLRVALDPEAFAPFVVLNGATFINFWDLPALCSLQLGFRVDDTFVVKVSERFRRLRRLSLCEAGRVTSLGYASLAALPELLRLDICELLRLVNGTEEGLHRLAERGRLEKFRCVRARQLTSATVVKFVQLCDNLRKMVIRGGPTDVKSVATAVAMIRQLIGRKRDLAIDFGWPETYKIWHSDKVAAALHDVNQANGCTIRVMVIYPVLHG